MRACYRCGTATALERVGVREVCETCSAYLHCCRNCDHYLPGAHNDCREPNAELVADKESGNFCDFFRFVAERKAAGGGKADDARRRLDALFGKKGDGR
ncbi:MAG: hypothetical protein ACREQ9_18440 [Candidatus Binatia bacterium]